MTYGESGPGGWLTRDEAAREYVVEPRRVFSQAVDAVVSPAVELGPFTPQTEHD